MRKNPCIRLVKVKASRKSLSAEFLVTDTRTKARRLSRQTGADFQVVATDMNYWVDIAGIFFGDPFVVDSAEVEVGGTRHTMKQGDTLACVGGVWKLSEQPAVPAPSATVVKKQNARERKEANVLALYAEMAATAPVSAFCI